MKSISFPCVFLALNFLPSFVSAQTPVAPRVASPAVEWMVEISHAAKSDIAEGTRPLGEISTFQSRASFLRTITSDAQSSWLLGGSWQRLEFSPAAGTPIPDSLSALALKIGYNRQLSPQWSLRTEIDPGIYSDFEDISADDLNAPLGVRAVYAASRELQWIFGLNLDWRSGNPVVGGAGVRWQFAPDWTLLFLIPAPRIEYVATPDLTFFAGANLRGGTFRVAKDFGRSRGRPLLDDQNIGYRELSAGAGARWKLSPAIALSAGAGWMFDRRFEFDDRDLLLNGDGALSFQLTLSGSF
ncbi:MAG: DUF6268 family outer membrane beta-barrel protein [Opitutaceae bacterium]